MRKVFTTGQVAKICKVAPRTVSKWFDSGRLRGYRIPGSQDRRIPREHLLRFMKDHGMPLGELEEETLKKVLTVCSSPDLGRSLAELLQPNDDYRLESATSGFEAGIKAEQFRPDCIVIDLAAGSVDGLQVARNLRQNVNFRDVVLLAVVDEHAPLDGAELKVAGFNDYFVQPFDASLLVERIRSLIRLKKE